MARDRCRTASSREAVVRWSIADDHGTPVPVSQYIQADDDGALVGIGGDALQLLPRKGASDTALRYACEKDEAACVPGLPRLSGSLYRALDGAGKVSRNERNPGVVVIAAAPRAEHCVTLRGAGRCDLPANVYVDGQPLGRGFRLHYLWNVQGDVDFGAGADLAASVTRLEQVLQDVIVQERVDELVLAAREQAQRSGKRALIGRTRKLAQRAEKHSAQAWTSQDFSEAQQRALLVKLTDKKRGKAKRKK